MVPTNKKKKHVKKIGKIQIIAKSKNEKWSTTWINFFWHR